MRREITGVTSRRREIQTSVFVPHDEHRSFPVLHHPLCLDAFPLVTFLHAPTFLKSSKRAGWRLTDGVRTIQFSSDWSL